MPSPPPLGLYVHLPWCARKCPYCDFNSHTVSEALPERDYVTALLADLETEAAAVPGRPVDTIFIGGGTPSLFSPEAIAALLAGVRERCELAVDAEITLEANPGSSDSGKFRGFREAGVNRLSIGVQSFDPGHLARLGRVHDRAEAFAAIRAARAAGFENINLDLMFGLPEQRPGEALADIRTAIAEGPAHISFYQLTLEPHTRFHKYPPALPTEDATWEAQQECQNLLAEAGYRQYEVSAYALESRRCRHNLNYWRFGDYLGIGAGAHGKRTAPDTGTVIRSWKVRHPLRYLTARCPAERLGGETWVTASELPFEFLMNALRLREGFAETDFTDRTGLPLSVLEPMLAACLGDGLLERRGDLIRCSDSGYNFLDDILQRFLDR